jgi:DNA-binding LacI/PurR family transcriptional regulator
VMRNASNVSDGRRQAVLDAASELGYRPHAMARSLARRRTNMVGVLLSDLHNPYFAELYDGMEAAAHRRGLQVMITTGDRRPAGEWTAVESLLELRMDGIILASTRLDARRIVEASKAVPLALIARPSRAATVDTVVCDDVHGAELAVDHLVSLGHRRIAHIDGGTGAGARSRRRGYERAMRRHGLADSIRVVHGEFTEAAGARAAFTLLGSRTHPTAIFVANDLAAVGALNVLEVAGYDVPGEISLVGFDNAALARIDHISLTTIDQPRFEMGRLAMEALIERLDGRTAPTHVVLPPSLVVRRSTAPV